MGDSVMTDPYKDMLKRRVAGLPLFGALNHESFDSVWDDLEWFSVAGGWTLFKEHDPADAAFFVLSGRLAVIVAEADGEERILSQICAGETVGEMALVDGTERSATVIALRDSELLRLPRDAFERLIGHDLHAQRFLIQLLTRRLRESSHRPASEAAPHTLTLLPMSPAINADEFAADVAREIELLGRKTLVLGRDSYGRDTQWFANAEQQNDLLVYQADCDASEWTRLCLRQADRVLLAVAAGPPPNPADARAIDAMLRAKRPGTVELVVVHQEHARRQTFTRMLLGRYKAGSHCHVRAGKRTDMARLARMISGRAVGIVLSGGAARGFAHIGVIRALREARIPLDLFGAASMGSIVGALAALEMTEEEILSHMLPSFVAQNPLNDYTLPVVALARGRKVTNLLRQNFGDKLIEECWSTFFCTATDLTAGRVRVFRHGPLWKALRASVAIPGVISPIIEGDHILVDGGVLNNMPIDEMLAMQRGPVIAVDVMRDHTMSATAEDLEARPLWQLLRSNRRGAPNIIALLMRAGTVGSEAQIRHLRPHVDLVIEPKLQDISMLDWKSYRRAIEGGYRETVAMLEKKEIAQLLSP